MEATQVSFDRWMDKQNVKQNVVYTCTGTLFSFQKEGNFDPCYNIERGS